MWVVDLEKGKEGKKDREGPDETLAHTQRATIAATPNRLILENPTFSSSRDCTVIVTGSDPAPGSAARLSSITK
jgi:hypothetical protein